MSIYAEHQRKQRIKSVVSGIVGFFDFIWPFAAGVVVISLIVWGVGTWVRSNNNDYAGYGPNRVTLHDSRALGEWMLHDAEVTGRVRSVYANHKAWATQYRLDKRTICVYVWGGANTSDHSQVEEGVCH